MRIARAFAMSMAFLSRTCRVRLMTDKTLVGKNLFRAAPEAVPVSHPEDGPAAGGSVALFVKGIRRPEYSVEMVRVAVRTGIVIKGKRLYPFFRCPVTAQTTGGTARLDRPVDPSAQTESRPFPRESKP